MTKILFLDESGDHNLQKIDDSHPIFCLGGIIVDEGHAQNQMINLLNEFKYNLFGHANVYLHTVDFTRQKNGFELMKDRDFCANFYEKINLLIKQLDITIIACAVKKKNLCDKYGLNAIDPYYLSLRILVERFVLMLKDKNEDGVIIAESRNHVLDKQLDLAWLDLKNSGTNYVQASQIQKFIKELKIETKNSRLAGLEIADAVVTPIARDVLERKSRIDINIIKEKMRKSHNGDIKGYGMVVIP